MLCVRYAYMLICKYATVMRQGYQYARAKVIVSGDDGMGLYDIDGAIRFMIAGATLRFDIDDV